MKKSIFLFSSFFLLAASAIAQETTPAAEAPARDSGNTPAATHGSAARVSGARSPHPAARGGYRAAPVLSRTISSIGRPLRPPAALNFSISVNAPFDEAVAAIGRIGEIDRTACRRAVEQRFTVERDCILILHSAGGPSLPEEQATEFEKFDSFTQFLTGNAQEADTQFGLTSKSFKFRDYRAFYFHSSQQH